MATQKRPLVSVRNSDVDRASKIVEASIPQPNGVAMGLLVGFYAAHDNKVLYVRPYRADAEVYIMTKDGHAFECDVYHSIDPGRRCDCGACLVYDAAKGQWLPTRRGDR